MKILDDARLPFQHGSGFISQTRNFGIECFEFDQLGVCGYPLGRRQKSGSILAEVDVVLENADKVVFAICNHPPALLVTEIAGNFFRGLLKSARARAVKLRYFFLAKRHGIDGANSCIRQVLFPERLVDSVKSVRASVEVDNQNTHETTFDGGFESVRIVNIDGKKMPPNNSRLLKRQY